MISRFVYGVNRISFGCCSCFCPLESEFLLDWW